MQVAERPVALLPPDAPFSAPQRAWLDGFFTGLLVQLAAGRGAALASAAPVVRLALHVLYASQTGTAEGLARKFAKEARGKGLEAQAQDLGTLSMAALAKLGHVVVIASTHGEGDPPDAVGAFMMQLECAAGQPLAGLNYAVLALGDRNYVRFCAFGRVLDERFAALGAARLAPRLDADADVTQPFAQFREALWPALAAALPVGASAPAPAAGAAGEEPEAAEAQWSRQRPFPALLRSKARLGGEASDKDVRHVVLSLAGSGLHYEPGDALGVWPRQSPRLVEAVLTASGLSADAPVMIDGQVLALGEALAARHEIARLAAPSVIKLAALSEDADLLSLVQPEQGEALLRFLHGKDIVDLLQRWPGLIGEPRTLIDLLPPLAPRLYSISSSLLAFPEQVHLTVATVRFECQGRARGGVASSWLADRLDADDPAPVYVQRNSRFRLPADPGVPIIMIGPGTGIAPFRAFLHHRRAQGLTTPSWLFFGDRHAGCDHLYRDELESFVRERELTRLDLAFSRDQPEKIYVQQRMIESGRELWSWLDEGATIYVCGDAERMAKDVDAALRTIIATHGRRSAAQAQLELREMAAAGRYVRDVY
ncbi:MAG: flavodoxin domain-containing protein [Pseudomonadota bacterium]|nr:flavodoxin domain-containing protein [Pseudomonadota bacterium]